MKKKTLMIILPVIFLTTYVYSYAQQFTAGEQVLIRPSQVIIENYVIVKLSKEIIDEPNANRFEVSNPYTYLQTVLDAAGKRSHIVFQTNFFGKILFLSYSNNISGMFNKKGKPMNLFIRCLNKVNDHISPVQITEAVIGCIIDRLNYCYENQLM